MKKIARCYGVWGCPYYRTKDGHTFSIKETPGGKIVFYFGNVFKEKNVMKLLTEAEKKELFSRVEFVN